MNVIKEIERITALELEAGIIGGMTNGSWHEKYKNSAWVYVGGMSYELSEGDIICFMSQWGEIEDINLVREKGTNKSMGYAFVKYEDQRSTILAVDNFNGIKLLGRVLRCDHVDRYRLPKELLKREEELLEENPNHDVEIGPGHAYKHKKTPLHGDFNINQGIDLWASPSSSSFSSSSSSSSSTRNHISKSLNDHGVVESKSDGEEQDYNNENVGEFQRKEKKRKHDKEGKQHHHSKKHKKEKKEKRHAHDYSEEENRDVYVRSSRSRSRSPSDNDSRRSRDRELKSSLPTAVEESSVSRGMAPTTFAATTTAKSSYSTAGATTSHMSSSKQQPQALSWRGVHDPALLAQQQQQRSGDIAGIKSSASASSSSSGSNNNTTTIDHRSFGGMNRRR